MINVAIVEDKKTEQERLCGFIDRFSMESGEKFETKVFTDALSFLDGYKGYNLVFMDIEMPFMNGMDAALKLRKIDTQAVLIFVTNMAQYAVKGYEADALDFIVKPVSYSDFSFKMKRAMHSISVRRPKEIVIASKDGLYRVSQEEFLYVEVKGHNLTYHLTDGRVVEARGKLSDAEELLKVFGCLRCHNSYLLNPRHINIVKDYTVEIQGEELPISHPRKKQFMQELTAWYGKGTM